jgi:hypothetical protein
MTIQKFGPKSLVTAVGLQKFDKSQANSAPTFYAIWVSLSLPSFDPSAERRLAAGNWLMEAAAPPPPALGGGSGRPWKESDQDLSGAQGYGISDDNAWERHSHSSDEGYGASGPASAHTYEEAPWGGVGGHGYDDSARAALSPGREGGAHDADSTPGNPFARALTHDPTAAAPLTEIQNRQTERQHSVSSGKRPRLGTFGHAAASRQPP